MSPIQLEPPAFLPCFLPLSTSPTRTLTQTHSHSTYSHSFPLASLPPLTFSPPWSRSKKRAQQNLTFFLAPFVLFSDHFFFFARTKLPPSPNSIDSLLPSVHSLTLALTPGYPFPLPPLPHRPVLSSSFPFLVKSGCLYPTDKGKKKRKKLHCGYPTFARSRGLVPPFFLPLPLSLPFFQSGFEDVLPGPLLRWKYILVGVLVFGSLTHSHTHLLIHAVALLHKPNHVLSFVFHVQSKAMQSKHGLVLYTLSFSLVGSIARSQPTFSWFPPPPIDAINVAQHAHPFLFCWFFSCARAVTPSHIHKHTEGEWEQKHTHTHSIEGCPPQWREKKLYHPSQQHHALHAHTRLSCKQTSFLRLLSSFLSSTTSHSLALPLSLLLILGHPWAETLDYHSWFLP